jgi:hypothetical protein
VGGGCTCQSPNILKKKVKNTMKAISTAFTAFTNRRVSTEARAMDTLTKHVLAAVHNSMITTKSAGTVTHATGEAGPAHSSW